MIKLLLLTLTTTILCAASTLQAQELPQPQITLTQLAPVTQKIVGQSPAPGWYFIGTTFGPYIPAPWQLIGVEAVLQNGTTVSAWQMFLYNPNTRQTAGWLVGL